MKATIKLFRAVPITAKPKSLEDIKTDKDILKHTLKYGYVFSPEVVHSFTTEELWTLSKVIESEIGISGEQINSSFHKSWEKIKTASMEQLVVEQLIHYFTTYGFKAMGIDSPESVYVPNEKLELPELKEEGLNITIIKGYTKTELKEKLLNLLQSGLALKDDTKKDVIYVAKFLEFTPEDVDTIKNKEVKVAMYDSFEYVPKNPSEFLRYVIYRVTGKTLLIKDKATIGMIKQSLNVDISMLFFKYKIEYGLDKLASIFYRYKPLFLAFRRKGQINWYINKIRKLAKKYHKPMPEDYLNEVTSKLKQNIDIDVTTLKEKLNSANVFRKIRLAYALKFRTHDTESIMYRIRNGGAYAKSFEFKNTEKAKEVLDIVMESIANDIKKNVRGKKIYIPNNITYTLPATEKQFTDMIPAGSYVEVDDDMLAGIYWENVQGQTDLDLSIVNNSVGKIGWDSSYRTQDRGILFSGDITDARNGASELFYLSKHNKGTYILMLNYFNYREEVPVPFKIVVASEKINDLPKNYMVNPNNIVAVGKTIIDMKQKVLGMVDIDDEKVRFYFTETYLGNTNTSRNNDFVEHSRKYLLDYYRNSISLLDVLKTAGAVITEDKEECDIDLSLGTLEKDTILNLLKE